MGHQFCTSCGHGAAADCSFCENCGVVFLTPESVTKLESSEPGQETVLPLHRTRGLVSTWIMPFNAALIFGITLAGVFDFLSPRIALLPIAASVAVTGLIVVICLRKFVAPGLPEASKLKRALAPAAGLHRSPLMIVTGVLSALMVTGAAWSSAASASGGVIASKFDGARNAQMQLGVLQSLQKEQRVQTAVLEDIREGRTLNPRRELANQGVAWNGTAFSDALEASDAGVVSLFLTGGMKWNLSRHATRALKTENDTMSQLLLQHPANWQKSHEGKSDCELFTSNFMRRENVADRLQAVALSTMEKKFIRTFCATPEDIDRETKALKQAEIRNAETIESYKKAFAAMTTTDQCIRQMTDTGLAELSPFVGEYQVFGAVLRADGREYAELVASIAGEYSSSKLRMTPKIVNAVTQYCIRETAGKKPNLYADNWDTVHLHKQLLDAMRGNILSLPK